MHGVIVELLKQGPDGKFSPVTSVVSDYYDGVPEVKGLDPGVYAGHVIHPDIGQPSFPGFLPPDTVNPNGSDVREVGGTDYPGVIGPFRLDPGSEMRFDVGFNPSSPSVNVEIESRANPEPVQTGDLLSTRVNVDNPGYGTLREGRLMISTQGVEITAKPEGCVAKSPSSIICDLPIMHGIYTPNYVETSWNGQFDFRVIKGKNDPEVIAVGTGLYNNGPYSFTGGGISGVRWERIANPAEVYFPNQIFLPVVLLDGNGTNLNPSTPPNEDEPRVECGESGLPMEFEYNVRSAIMGQDGLYQETSILRGFDISPSNKSTIFGPNTWGYSPSYDNNLSPNSGVTFRGKGPYLESYDVVKLSCFNFDTGTRDIIDPNSDGSWTYGIGNIGQPTTCLLEWERYYDHCDGQMIIGGVAK